MRPAGPFRLYTREQPIFPFTDYAFLMGEVGRLGARSVVEFGPGHSTRAFLEAGVPRLVSLEHDERWRARAIGEFEPLGVLVLVYRDAPIVEIPALEGETFDLAFVDAPAGMGRRQIFHANAPGCSRHNTVMAALELAPVVVLHDAHRAGERATLERVRALGHAVETVDTGSEQGMARIARR